MRQMEEEEEEVEIKAGTHEIIYRKKESRQKK